jgi:phosphate transport system permease protein
MDADGTGLSLKATGRARKRLIVNKIAEALALVAAGLAIAVLVILVWSVLSRGIGALNVDFFTKGPVLFGEGGGILPAIVGTFILVAIATAIALPFGVLTAIYVSEFGSARFAGQVRLWLDILNGFPSIVIGVFVFTLIVKSGLPIVGWGHQQSAYAGGFALSIIMLPLVARATMEVLALVPNHLREASYALGTSKWRTIVSVVIPSALGGIVTGTTLAIARAAGETAPLLFTCAIAAGTTVNWDPGKTVNSIPLTIFIYSEQADPQLHEQAWAAAFVLIAFVLVTSLTARLLLDRSRRKLGQVK